MEESKSVAPTTSMRPIRHISHRAPLITPGPTDGTRIAASRALQEAYQSRLQAKQRALRGPLALPVRVSVATKWFGWTSWNPAEIFANVLESDKTREAVRGLNTEAHKHLSSATDALTQLFINIDPENEQRWNRTNLIKAVKASLLSVQTILEHSQPIRILRTPLKPDEPGYIDESVKRNVLARLEVTHELLFQYLGYLEGYLELTPIVTTKDTVNRLRITLFHNLFSSTEYAAFNDERALPYPPQGMLGVLLHFKSMQQGILKEALAGIKDAALQHVGNAVEQALGLPEVVCRDIDLPKFEDNGDTIITHHLDEVIQAGGLKGIIKRANTGIDPRLDAATRALTRLYANVEEEGEPDRADLITSVTESIRTLKAIAEAKNHFRIFQIAREERLAGLKDHLVQKVRDQIELLEEYLGYLEGTEIDGAVMACTTEDLRNLRFHVIRSLFSEKEEELHRASRDYGRNPEGLLAHFLYIKNSTQGFLDALLQSVMQGLAQHGVVAIREQLGLTSSSPCKEIDLPKLEVQPDGSIKRNHVDHHLSFRGIVQHCLDLFKTGSTEGVIRDTSLVLLATLNRVEGYLKSDSGKSLLSEWEATESEPEHPVLVSLRSCINLLDSSLDNSDLSSVLSKVKQILSKHSIWLGDLANFGLSLESKELITETLRMNQTMDRGDTRPRTVAKSPTTNDIQTLATEVAEISAYQATFNTIFSFFIKPERGSGVKPDAIPTFGKIWKKMTCQKDTIGKRKVLIEELRFYIDKASDVILIKRIFLKFLVPHILWISEHCIIKFKNGVLSNLTEFMQAARSTKSVSTEPIERLQKAVNALYKAHQLRHEDSGIINDDVAIETFCTKDKGFLEGDNTGCKTLSDVHLKAGDKAIHRYLGHFRPTRHLADLNESIFAWAADSEHKYVPTLCYIATRPVTLLFSFVNKFIIFPVEWLSNKVTHLGLTFLLRSGSFVERAHLLFGDAMFPADKGGRPSSKIMNEVLISFLGKLSDLLDHADDPKTEEKFKISEESMKAMGNAVSEVIAYLGIKETRNLDALKRFQRADESSGISPALAHLMRFIMGRDTKKLDDRVSDAIRELLARCYYVLMNDLESIVHLALTSVKEGMIQTDAPQPLAAGDNGDEALLNDLKVIVVQKAAHLTHSSLSKGLSRDKELRDHVRDLKGKYLSAGDRKGLLQRWDEALRANPNVPRLDQLFEETKQSVHDLQNEILRLKKAKQDGLVGGASYERHANALSGMVDALSNYLNTFLKTYSLVAMEGITKKETTIEALDAAFLSLASLPGQSNVANINKTIKSIKLNLLQLRRLFDKTNCPTQIQDFIQECDNIAYDRSLSETASHLDRLRNFTQKISELKVFIPDISIARNLSELSKQFKTIHVYISDLPEKIQNEILLLEKDIASAIKTAQNADVLERAAASYASLEKRLVQITGEFQAQYDAKLAIIGEVITEQSRRASEIKELLSPQQATSSEDVPAVDIRQKCALATDATIAALTPIDNAIKYLETVSSIRIPIDKFSFFNITESALIALLEDRIFRIEEELFIKRRPFMTLVYKMGVLSFLNPQDPTHIRF